MSRKYITDERFTRQKLHPHQEHYPLLLTAREKAEEHLTNILLPQHREGCKIILSTDTTDIILIRTYKDWYFSHTTEREYKTDTLIELKIPGKALKHIRQRRIL